MYSAILTLCIWSSLGTMDMPTPENPQGFEIPAGSWKQVFEQAILKVAEVGRQLYQLQFQTQNWLPSEVDCLVAQSTKGWALQVQASAKAALKKKPGSIPQDIIDQYDRNVERADRLVDDKCGGGHGGRGQALFAQWTQDLSAARGKYTRPAPGTVLPQITTGELSVILLKVWLSQEFWALTPAQPGEEHVKAEVRKEMVGYTLMLLTAGVAGGAVPILVTP
jgi:hypothetical protein